MGVSNIKIKNFTVFEDIEIDFASGINVIIGDNGTGKTHLMKLMNMLLRPQFNDVIEVINIRNYFKVSNDLDVVRNLENEDAEIVINYKGIVIKYLTGKNSLSKMEIFRTDENKKIQDVQLDNVYVPAKEILTHSKGFVSLYDERFIPFDKSYKDLLSKSLLPNLRNIPELGVNILPKLETIMEGKVVVEDDVFYILKTNGSQVVFDLEAEGIKKLALLWQLIMNGSIQKGSVIFWDEPESNINPKLIPVLVDILLELSNNEVQIFISTHDYILAKYIEVKSQDDDEILFHGLIKTKDGVKVETQNKFMFLSNNSIIDENKNLYQSEIEKVMK